MRGLTEEEAGVLRDNLRHGHPDDDETIDGNTTLIRIHDRLEARGLIEWKRIEWLEPGKKLSAQAHVTAKGLLILAIHEMETKK